jgi:RHS repeat-associated protein
VRNLLSSASGLNLPEINYDPYGTPNLAFGGLANFGYAGMFYHENSGLYLTHYRVYDPRIFRWLSRDPIGENGGTNFRLGARDYDTVEISGEGANLFSYVSDNPITRVDPVGLKIYPADYVGPLQPGDCYSQVPTAPPGVDINQNIKEAALHPQDPFWFRDQVKNHGPWDFKQQGRQFQNFGNFNYGATGAALGLTDITLLREAGRAQQEAGTSSTSWGDPGSRWSPSGGTPPYGDDPVDQEWIRRGIQYYNRYRSDPTPTGSWCKCSTTP